MKWFSLVDKRFGKYKQIGKLEVYCGPQAIGVEGDEEVLRGVVDFLNDESNPVAKAIADMLKWEHLP